MNLYPQRWLESLLRLHLCFDKTQEVGSTQDAHSESAPAVRCGYCRSVISQADAAIEMAGAHQHVLTNLAGVSFTVAVYRHAHCTVIGLPSAEWCWFNGYVWQIALCAHCAGHLGWYYSQAQFPDFYGLIASRLIIDGTGSRRV